MAGIDETGELSRVDTILSDWLDNAGDPDGAPPETIEAVEDVLMERRRQILVEGWTPEGDDKVFAAGGRADALGGPLSLAAAAYCLAATWSDTACRAWPFDAHWFKPRSHRENVVRAAALMLAEIERIDRAAARAGEAG